MIILTSITSYIISGAIAAVIATGMASVGIDRFTSTVVWLLLLSLTSLLVYVIASLTATTTSNNNC